MSGDQLRLAIEEPPPAGRLPAWPRLMQPTAAAAPFDDPEYFFEPWWPGARALLLRDGPDLRLQIEHLADPLASFPELDVLRRHVAADTAVVDGTLLVLDDGGRPDAELLRQRLEDPRQRRGLAAFVASDLLFAEGEAQSGRIFGQRRERLAGLVRDGERCVMSRGLMGEGTTLASAVASMGLAEISARCLGSRYRAGAAGDAWLRLPVAETPASETRPLLTLIRRLPL